MKNLKSLLTTTLPNTKAKIWQLLALLTLVNIIPLFLPEVIWRDYLFIIIGLWVAAYIILSRTIRTVLRVTSSDAVLIERYFVFLAFAASLSYGLLYGFRNGFDALLTTTVWFNGGIVALLLVGIIIHIKASDTFYHGVRKDELLK